MSNHFCVDVETLGLESTCIVLSAAIVYFSLDEDVDYDTLKKRTLYIKFDALEQKKVYGRSITKSTLGWWTEQPEPVQALAIKPHPNDLSAEVGLAAIESYVKQHGGPDSLFWQRGTLDSTSLESLARSLNREPFTNYNNWMDIRTAIRLTKETCNARAYCKVPGFDPIVVDKHHPVDDICYDVMMLVKGA